MLSGRRRRDRPARRPHVARRQPGDRHLRGDGRRPTDLAVLDGHRREVDAATPGRRSGDHRRGVGRRRRADPAGGHGDLLRGRRPRHRTGPAGRRCRRRGGGVPAGSRVGDRARRARRNGDRLARAGPPGDRLRLTGTRGARRGRSSGRDRARARTGPSRSPVRRSAGPARSPSKCEAGCGTCCPSGRTSGSGCARRRWPSRADRVDHRLLCPHPDRRGGQGPRSPPVPGAVAEPLAGRGGPLDSGGVRGDGRAAGRRRPGAADRQLGDRTGIPDLPDVLAGHPDHQRGLGPALETGSGDGVTERVTDLRRAGDAGRGLGEAGSSGAGRGQSRRAARAAR